MAKRKSTASVRKPSAAKRRSSPNPLSDDFVGPLTERQRRNLKIDQLRKRSLKPLPRKAAAPKPKPTGKGRFGNPGKLLKTAARDADQRKKKK